jgi:hypothetical protein
MKVAPVKTYTLIGRDGKPYRSTEKGTLGGYRRGSTQIYGRLDCKNAQAWIALGHYIPFRVFFADEESAIAAGFRPCGKCMPEKYVAWKEALASAG